MRSDPGGGLGRSPYRLPVDLLGDVEGEHLAPPRPVVVHVGAPEVEVVGDALGPEQVGELAGAVGGLVGALAADDVDLALVAEEVERA